jgi:hypothetical protein
MSIGSAQLAPRVDNETAPFCHAQSERHTYAGGPRIRVQAKLTTTSRRMEAQPIRSQPAAPRRRAAPAAGRYLIECHILC